MKFLIDLGPPDHRPPREGGSLLGDVLHKPQIEPHLQPHSAQVYPTGHLSPLT